MASSRCKPPAQAGGHLVGGGFAIGALFLRQDQAGFQIGQPGRHHQIIGGQFQIELLGAFDEFQILIGQLEDRDLGDVDLLVAGQGQQQVQRTFKAIHLHQQRLVVGEDGGGFKFVEIFDPFRHGHAPTSEESPSNAASRASAACGSNGPGADRCAKRLLAALERLSVQCLHFRCHVAHFVHIAIAVKHQVAARELGLPGAHRKGPVERLHGKVVRHQKPVKSYLTAYHIPNDFGAGGRRTLWINRLIDNMRSHGDGALVKTAKGHKIAGRKLFAAGRNPGQRQMAVGPCPAMAGNMLHHRQHAAVHQALESAPGPKR